jgi:hypothetical protein
MGIKRRFGLFYSPCISTPMAVGLFRHSILLPNTEYDEDELRSIFTHELTHIRRRDLWYRAFTLLVTAAHWFNPFVYYMGRQIDLLCEISCDSEVVRHRDSDERMRYTETIIGVVRQRARPLTTLTTGFYGGKQGMKTRITSIMDRGPKRAGLLFVCCVLVLTLGTGSTLTVVAPVEPARAALTPNLLEGLFSEFYFVAGESVYEYHAPMEGQIDIDEAIAIAKAATTRYIQNLIVSGEDYSEIELSVSDARLTQIRPVERRLVPLDPIYSHWSVSLSVPGEETSVSMNINAQTGIVVSATISGLRVDSSTEVSLERLYACYLEDLGVGGFPYTGQDHQIAAGMPETRILTNILDGTAQAAAYVLEGALVTEIVDGGLVTHDEYQSARITFNILLLPAGWGYTTQ